MKALIVGGSGATGVLLVQGLAERGFDVTVLHRGVHEPHELRPYRHIHTDPHFSESVSQALGEERFNVVVLTYGRLKLLAPLFADRCEKLIAIGGMPIYPGYLDPRAELPTGMPLNAREEDPLVDPARMFSPGAAGFVAKMLAAEAAVMTEHSRGSYAATIFRYPAIYGKYSSSLTEWSIIKRIQDNRPFVLVPDAGLGIITRCAAINAAHCVLSALDHSGAAGQVFNCADEQQYTLQQWLELMCHFLGSDIEILPIPPQLNWSAAHLLPLGGSTSAHGTLDISKAKTLLRYCDQVRAKDALAELMAWRLAHPPAAEDLARSPDPFDYALEDQIRVELDKLSANLAHFERAPAVIHSYPHPKAPSLDVDHRGR